MDDAGGARREGRVVGLGPCCLCVAALCAPIVPSAREGDRQQPIDVRARTSEFDERQGVQVLSGNVEITQGSMRIEADRITVFLEDSRLSRIEGEGAPIRFSQENDAGQTVEGRADGLVYDARSGELVLQGAARLEQPRQRLQSERIVFDTASQRVRAEGGDDGRVNIQIQPPEDAVQRATESGAGGDAQ